jgi:hypothetical protein
MLVLTDPNHSGSLQSVSSTGPLAESGPIMTLRPPTAKTADGRVRGAADRWIPSSTCEDAPWQ